MASSNDNHLSDIISIVQARPKSPPQEEIKPPADTPAQTLPQPPVEPVSPTSAPSSVELSSKDSPAAEIAPVQEPPAKVRKSRAGRKPLPDKNRRSEILIIRLTKAEKKKLWELAKKKHTTLSSFVRKVSIGEYDKED